MQKLIPALLLVLMAFVSCTKSDDDQAKVQNDLWTVTYFKDNGLDAQNETTADFAGYTFEFNDNQEWVFHSPTGSTTMAKWGLDATTSTVAFSIDNPPVPIDNLAGGWKITEQTNSTLNLTGNPLVTSPADVKGVVYFEKQ
jgi:hypothetical protein